MKSMQFYKDYFNDMDRSMRTQKRIKEAMKMEYKNLPEAEKARRRQRTMELVKEIEEMANVNCNNYGNATQGY